MAGLAEDNKNYRQLLIKFFFEQHWKVVENTKVVHYFDNSKGIFLFEAQISTVWLKIKFKIYRQVEGATCQHLGVTSTTSKKYCRISKFIQLINKQHYARAKLKCVVL